LTRPKGRKKKVSRKRSIAGKKAYYTRIRKEGIKELIDIIRSLIGLGVPLGLIFKFILAIVKIVAPEDYVFWSKKIRYILKKIFG